MDVSARTRVVAAITARDLSDSARAVVAAVIDGHQVGDLISIARRARAESLTLLDHAVLEERAAGATWEQIAYALRKPLDEVVARYEPVFDRWVVAGLDPDVGARAAAHRPVVLDVDDARVVDSWRARHADPWDEGPAAHLVDLIA